MHIPGRRLILLLLLPPAIALADWKSDIGYTALQTRLGANTPNGAGIDVTQVEALYRDLPTDPYAYLPNPSNTEFTQPPSLAKVFTPECSTCNNAVYSTHALYVGRQLYGNTVSIAPGIINIDVNEANNWLSGTLNFNTQDAPDVETRRIQNTSWVGAMGSDNYSIDVLRRLDWTIHRDGVLTCVSADNGSTNPMPKLLSSAHNAMTVGLASGASSYGPATLEPVPGGGTGRVKPDIVAPSNLTSYATPIVGSCAALLLQTMDAGGYLSSYPLRKELVVKALLMAGATKSLLNAWRKGFANASTDGTVPLDYRFGAGMVNIDNSHRILTAGEQNASGSSLKGLTGWDYNNSIAAGGTAQYFFDVPAFSYIQQVSILVTWNRHIAGGGGNPLNLDSTLANIDLKLYRATGFTRGALVDQSISTLDNVEHIFLKQLTGGRYVFEVHSDVVWEYAIAWDVTLGTVVRPDQNGDGAVDDADVNLLGGCETGALAGPPGGSCGRADIDNDTDVDQDDFGLLQRCYAGPGVVAAPTCYP